jgi:hypothetical protein
MEEEMMEYGAGKGHTMGCEIQDMGTGVGSRVGRSFSFSFETGKI